MEENKLERQILCELKAPSVEYRDSYLAALKEYTSTGQPFDEGIRDPGKDFNFNNLLQDLKDESKGPTSNNQVPQTTLWIVDKGGYAGRVSLRHPLNADLLRRGGNIWYGVIPSKRDRGYAKKALELILPKARALGLTKVLLTCDSTNIPSRKIIEENGGVLENEVANGEGKPNILRFWIEL